MYRHILYRLMLPYRRYLAHGTATDYMFDELKVPLPMTWEVYGDQRAGGFVQVHDCFVDTRVWEG
jgi:hypothetical protein